MTEDCPGLPAGDDVSTDDPAGSLGGASETAAPGPGVDPGATGPTGFVLRRLLLIGTHAPPATLQFERGLNIITGSSDTGKSFAVECLDFMLGATTRPREIPEVRPYEQVALEIESAAGEVLTLERSLGGGQVRCYPVSYAEITNETPFEKLGAKHNPRSEATLSFRLLALCGLAGRMLRQNVRNDTRPVSIRNVAKLVLVDEERVITRKSPALGDVAADATADRSLFALMLTGRDDSGLVSQGDMTERKARLIAQVDLLDGLLGPATAPNAPPSSDRTELARRRDALQAHIQEITDRVAAGGRAIDEARAESAAALEGVVAGRSRLIVVGELLSRFALLRRSYETDLQRLDFIAEGHHYFSQLSAVVCPACSRPFDEDMAGHPFCNQETPLAGDVQAACTREASKIRVHLRDLEAAVADLEAERAELQQRIRSGSERYRRLEQQVQSDLRPRLGEAAEELRQAVGARNHVVQEEAALDHRTGLLEKKLEIERVLQELASGEEAPGRTDEVPYQAFADTVGALLRAWRYPGEGRVTFDERRMDIVVDGGARELHGKGVRAIMYAAFVIGLMRFCRSRSLPHPGFVVLDSPLTTYRRRGGTPLGEMDHDAEGEGEAPEDMQRAFFENLAESAAELGEQIVLLENKEPPAHVIEHANYVQFTGIPGTGRAGFIPKGSE